MSFLESLRARAAALKTTLAFPEATDPRTATTMARLLAEEVCSVVAVGPAHEVRDALAAAGAATERVEIVDPSEGHVADEWGPVLHERRRGRMTADEAVRVVRDPLILGGLLLAGGRVDGVVAGAVNATPDVVRAALWCVGPDHGIRTVSSAFYMVVPPFRGPQREVLTFADAGVVPDPSPEQLVDIAVAAARARVRIVGDEPRVAFLSYSTLGSASGPSVDRIRCAVRAFRERMPGVAADGELQGDAALIGTVAERKAPDSDVAGRANVLIFPDLDAGNIAYKLVQRIAGGQALGPILQGLRRPYNDLSRGSSADEIFEVACITALMSDQEGPDVQG